MLCYKNMFCNFNQLFIESPPLPTLNICDICGPNADCIPKSKEIGEAECRCPRGLSGNPQEGCYVKDDLPDLEVKGVVLYS